MVVRTLLLIALSLPSGPRLGGAEIGATLPADHARRMARGIDLFQKDVAALLREHCVKCHGGEKTKSDFDLTTREDLLRGGKEGAAIVAFDAKQSRLVRLISHIEEPAMPDEQPKLADDAIAKISAWIDAGAPYAEPLVAGKKPNRDRSKVTADDRNWWAFRSLARIEISNLQSSISNPVDALLMEKAKGTGLALAPPAGKQALIRRAFLDLTGLPPSPEEAEAFVHDTSPEAWGKLIDQLLDSPSYGERWARHWLDVARFAESSGFEHDYDRPFAYHYRDFVIRALNLDMPYDQFVRWQLAGDEFAPDDPLALAATGFLGAGVFPTQITANEVERTRYDAMDDMLSTTGSAMLGLTIGCARCHDHKYDPIPTRDYYRMLSTFTTTVRSNVEVDMEPEKTRELRAVWDVERGKLAEAESRAESSLQPRFGQWLAGGMAGADQAVWTLLEPTELKSNAKSKFKALGDGSFLAEGEAGAHDVYTITATTAQRRITGLKLEALKHPSMKRGGPGRAPNGNFGLGKITVMASPATGGAEIEVKIARAMADHEQNKGTLSIAASLDEDPGSGWAVDGQIGKDHMAVFVFDEPLDFSEGAKLTIKLNFSVNTQHSIGRPRFSVMSDAEPELGGGVLAANVGGAMRRVREGGDAAKLGGADRVALFDWWKQREPSWQDAHKKLSDHLAREPVSKTTVMICGEGHAPIVMHSQGAPFFEETFFLKRGNTDLKDGVAPSGFLQVLVRRPDEKTWQWQPAKDAKISGRRRAFSNWVTDVEGGAGALLARVIVNRLWQHHFGRGIVATPNDFGKQGTLPGQPDLLDWLAGELIRGGWKLKPLHKLMMTSDAYRLDTARDARKEAADPANDLFMRRVPQRLEGESIRDSMLAVSGLLDDTMYGAGTRDEMSRRRSIYFNIKRSQLIGSMVAFDAPEPLVSQGARPTTTVAPQALILMNSPQVRAWAEALARRIEADCQERGSTEARIARAYALCFARPPKTGEVAAAAIFIAQQNAGYTNEKRAEAATFALADFCQVLFGLNEFVYQP